MAINSVLIIILLLICIGIQAYQTKESFSSKKPSQDNIKKKIAEIAAKTRARTAVSKK